MTVRLELPYFFNIYNNQNPVSSILPISWSANARLICLPLPSPTLICHKDQAQNSDKLLGLKD